MPPSLARRIMSVVVLGLFAIAAFVHARFVCSLVYSRLVVSVPAFPVGIPPPPSATSWHRVSASRFWTHDPSPPQGPVASDPRGERAAGSVPAPYDAPDCGGLEIAATAVDDDPRVSFAVVRDGHGASVRRRGDPVGSREIAFIAFDRVFLRDAAGTCQSRLYGAHASIETVPGAPPPPPRDPMLARIEQKTRRLGANEIEIDREAFELAIEHSARLFQGARFFPEKDTSGTSRVRLARAPEGGLFGLLGLRSGDVIGTVNGRSLGSTDEILSAYGSLRTAPHLSLTFERDGRAMTTEVHVR
jgi:type II secretory pathway component PulC